mgnify:FL=1|tara:strand:+ start:167 stop:709 length:543 start_codon:yes stop_codon:yes gene_type:complete
MFKTSKRHNYTIKNNTHIFTQESTMKMSRGEKYTLTIQRTYDTLTGRVNDKFLKERTILNITKTIFGKSNHYNDWNIRKMDRDNIIRDEIQDYKKFSHYFYELPCLDKIIDDNIEEKIRKFSRNKLKKLFYLDDTDAFFYLEGNEPQLHTEGETGNHLGTCFVNEFFNDYIQIQNNENID